jgi:hypothetical protein
VRDRRVINIFTDLFTKSFESLKFVRWERAILPYYGWCEVE